MAQCAQIITYSHISTIAIHHPLFHRYDRQLLTEDSKGISAPLALKHE